MRDSLVFLILYSILCSTVGSDADAEHKIVVKPTSWEEDLFFHIIEPEILSYFYRVRTAKDFGTKFNCTLKHVPLVLVDPPQGCGRGVNNALKIMGNIALVVRGGCSFMTKTLNAEAVGAIAVIIADSNEEDPGGVMIDMVHDGTERSASIPALYLIGKSGQMIRHKLKELGMDHAIIDIPVNSTSIAYNIHVRQPPWSLW